MSPSLHLQAVAWQIAASVDPAFLNRAVKVWPNNGSYVPDLVLVALAKRSLMDM